jgi:hypothetical protein
MIRGKEIVRTFAIPFRAIGTGLFAGSNPESFARIDIPFTVERGN